MKWYITYSHLGDCPVDGFFCPDCFTLKMQAENSFEMIEADKGNKYECECCGKDYRDEKMNECSS